MVNGIQLVTAEELKSALGISLDASMPEGGVASDESSLRVFGEWRHINELLFVN